MSQAPRKWKLPDPAVVQLPAERQDEIRRLAIIHARYEFSRGDPFPSTQDDDSRLFDSEFGSPDALASFERERERLTDEARSELRWKDSAIAPDGYVPPSSQETLEAAIAAGDTHFSRSRLREVDLSDFPMGGPFNFDDARFDRCDFSRAHLDGASFRRASFIGCTGFESVSARRADFTGAKFEYRTKFSDRTELAGATFDEADLEPITGIRFDSNSVLRTRFPSDTSSDVWSTLRRKYNGLSLFMNALLLLVFVAPMFAKLVGLVAYGQLLERQAMALQWLQSQLPAAAVAQITQILATHGTALTTCGTPGAACESQFAFFIVLTSAGDSWYVRVAAMLAAIVFVLRYWLTVGVAECREDEDRTSYTPSSDRYGRLATLDGLLTVARWPLYVFYLWVFGGLALTKIPIPLGS